MSGGHSADSQLRRTAAPASPDFFRVGNWVAGHRAALEPAAAKGLAGSVTVSFAPAARSGGGRVPHSQAERVHEVEGACPRRSRLKQHGAGGGATVVPAHVRQDRGFEPVDGAREDAAALGAQAEFHALGEEHLHADADAEDRAVPPRPGWANRLLAADAAQPGQHAANAPTPGTTRPSHSAAACRSAVTVTWRLPGERPLGGAQVSRTVIEDHDP